VDRVEPTKFTLKSASVKLNYCGMKTLNAVPGTAFRLDWGLEFDVLLRPCSASARKPSSFNSKIKSGSSNGAARFRSGIGWN